LRDLRRLKARKPSAFHNLLLLAGCSVRDVDCIQDISLELLEKKNNYDFTKGSLNTWGHYIIMKHLYPHDNKGFTRTPKGVQPEMSPTTELEGVEAPDDMTPIKLELEEYLSYLTHKERDLLMDRYIIGLTAAEMAHKYKFSVQYVHRVINKLLKFLRKIIDPDSISKYARQKTLTNKLRDESIENDTNLRSYKFHRK
jgi:RNA polymerase sigma factor (sigma-70 family)